MKNLDESVEKILNLENKINEKYASLRDIVFNYFVPHLLDIFKNQAQVEFFLTYISVPCFVNHESSTDDYYYIVINENGIFQSNDEATILKSKSSPFLFNLFIKDEHLLTFICEIESFLSIFIKKEEYKLSRLEDFLTSFSII
jgi:hypothetical protein